MAEEKKAVEPPGAAGDGGRRFQVTDRRHWAQKEKGEPPPEADLRPSYVRQLEEKLSAQERRLREYMERAEAENAAFRARQQRELERRTLENKEAILRAFLPLADDLARALEAAGASAGESESGLLEGLRLIEARFQAALSAQGAEPVPDVGSPFDPAIHEAVGVVEVDEGDRHGRVVEVVQRGYRLGESLLRPARVRVVQARRGEGEGEKGVPPGSQG
ncbi:MAG: nucleotide exchange factor GrpE [Nitrospinota bacterium]